MACVQTNSCHIPCYHQCTLPSTPFVATSATWKYLHDTALQLFLPLHKKICHFQFRFLAEHETDICRLTSLHCHFQHLPETYAIIKRITGSTVVLTCCKGDSQSQWETPIFGPSQHGNPLTDFDKIWNRWLHRPCDPLCQIWFLYVQRGRVPI